MFCRFCGSDIPNDSVFCPKCGKALNQEGDASSPAPKKAKKSKTFKKMTMGELMARPLSIIYMLLAIVCMIPLGMAEYRRLVAGIPLDATYWLLASPVLLSVLFVFLIFGPQVIGEVKADDQAEFEKTGVRQSHVGEAVCNLLSAILLPIGVLCFLISGLVKFFG